MVGSPPRLAVDIQGIDLNPALRDLVGKIKPGDPFINGLRVGQYAPNVVRIVFDLKQAVQPQVFSLAPIAAYQHRLVLDLYPERPVDPMEALIAERLRDAPRAGSGDNATAASRRATWPRSVRRGRTPTRAPRPAPTPLGDLMAQQSRAGRPRRRSPGRRR